ncbi:DUF2935 domain-containing protein [Peribacillus deserti]|uniref:DUF2935 domain-containing protein n=1 Tax=Peribacillus deserti TaxID=673318 RepID=A0A2N5MAM9_9BACI|nr:DUF2935 domain-containing protein [Peribacillus deserti]PLT31428.1 hypothetical protein CUU66_02775 [Peribacillus deserti]
MSNLKEAVFEHTFWLQVLGDHSRFILESLAPKEKEDIVKAEFFKKRYDDLLNAAKNLEPEEVVPFTKMAKELSLNFREFKLSIIRRHVLGRITIHLTPTFINHMVNELEEYLLIIRFLERDEKPPVFHELHHHLLWLLDASGHAGGIHDTLDSTEKDLKYKTALFEKTFEQFYLKAIELTGYLRANITSFPALEKMNKDVKLEIEIFKMFLEEVEELRLSDYVLGTFSVLMADHMAREECYYLSKLAESAKLEEPECNPGKPRARN